MTAPVFGSKVAKNQTRGINRVPSRERFKNTHDYVKLCPSCGGVVGLLSDLSQSPYSADRALTADCMREWLRAGGFAIEHWTIERVRELEEGGWCSCREAKQQTALGEPGGDA